MPQGLPPSIAVALIEFSEEVNYGVVRKKADIPIFQILKQPAMQATL